MVEMLTFSKGSVINIQQIRFQNSWKNVSKHCLGWSLIIINLVNLLCQKMTCSVHLALIIFYSTGSKSLCIQLPKYSNHFKQGPGQMPNHLTKGHSTQKPKYFVKVLIIQLKIPIISSQVLVILLKSLTISLRSCHPTQDTDHRIPGSAHSVQKPKHFIKLLVILLQKADHPNQDPDHPTQDRDHLTQGTDHCNQDPDHLTHGLDHCNQVLII